MEISKVNENKTFKQIATGIGIAFLITILALIIFSCILTYTNIGENTMPTVIIVITAISILIGSSIGNAKIRKNGLINGAIVGGGYLLIIYLISSILNWRFMINFQSLIMIIIGVIFGILGGIIGVNRK